jgi:hypothetical protein
LRIPIWSCGLCLAVCLLPKLAVAQEAQPITPLAVIDEPMRYPPSSVRPGLIAGGLVLTAAAYGAGAACAANWPAIPGSNRLYIPVAGPWIALAEGGCPSDNPDCGASLALRSILLVISGVSQAGGLGVAAEGVFMTTEADAPAKKEAGAGWRLLPVPIASRGSLGMAVVGRF